MLKDVFMQNGSPDIILNNCVNKYPIKNLIQTLNTKIVQYESEDRINLPYVVLYLYLYSTGNYLTTEQKLSRVHTALT